MQLIEALDRSIGDFCENRLTDPAVNHAAHFVAHVLDIDLGYDCRTHTGRAGKGGSLRVHELFARCPVVGHFRDAPPGACLLFVTDRGNVDLAHHSMRNVAHKHVGIFDGDQVYHYSNRSTRVIRQTPEQFLARFQAIYSGAVSLFYGTLPQGARAIGTSPQPGRHALAELTQPVCRPGPRVSTRQVVSGRHTDYYGRLESAEEFHLGRKTRYRGQVGLMQPGDTLHGPIYSAAHYTGQYGAAAALVGVIATSESGGYFNRLNSYDRASFTFGFFQLAAHTPDDNLILLFRRLASTHAEFRACFPELVVVDGRLHRRLGEHGVLSLETAYPRPGKPNERVLKDFMAWLNGDPASVDAVELDTATRLIALARDSSFNAIQVDIAVEISMAKLCGRYDPWYDLDGRSDLVCTAIADIHHQGRGSKVEVRRALSRPDEDAQLEALCAIGAANFAGRCTSLRHALDSAHRDGLLGQSSFDRASGLLQPSSGWCD